MEYDLNLIQKIIIYAIPLIFAITVHEVAHGWVANKCGDPTAKMLGRLTLNPIKHIDPIGTILVPGILIFVGGFIFGWAKPVPVDWRNLRSPRRDMALVAFAGPLANLLMALIWACILKLGIVLKQQGFNWALGLIFTGKVGISVNLMLLVLNLIPLPPLDGSKVISSLLSRSAAYAYAKIEPFGFFILLALLATGILGNIIGPPVMILQGIIYGLIS